MTHTPTEARQISAIKSQINLKDYDSLKVGSYIMTVQGEFIVISKPNIYQPIDTRYWEFELTEDMDGEPVMNSKILKIK